MRRFNRREFLAAGAGGLLLPRAALARGQLAVGFIFVGASWCPWCKAAAPIVYDLAAEERLPTLVVSKDARPIPPFSDFVEAAGHPVADAIEAIPALLVYAPATDSIIARIDGFKDGRLYRGRIIATLRDAVRLGYVQAS